MSPVLPTIVCTSTHHYVKTSSSCLVQSIILDGRHSSCRRSLAFLPASALNPPTVAIHIFDRRREKAVPTGSSEHTEQQDNGQRLRGGVQDYGSSRP